MDHGKSQAGPFSFFLGGKKRIEDPIEQGLGDADAGVADLDAGIVAGFQMFNAAGSPPPVPGSRGGTF